MSPHATQQLIAQILAFTANTKALETKLRKLNDTDWEDLVKIASAHLVLTTVYCRLQQKQLLYILPKDLKIYLHDLTAINRNRNNTIFKQIEALSQLLKTNNINHVFIKGAALLVADYYNDFGERMICDIDILIEPTQLKKASQLIQTLGYHSQPLTFGLKYKQPHNAPLLMPKKEGIATVELHRHVLHKYSKKFLPTKNLLDQKVSYKTFYIPSKQQLLSHIILNFEINDYGYNQIRLGFRNVYDFIMVLNEMSDIEIRHLWIISKYHKDFIAKAGVYFKEIKSYRLTYYNWLRYYIFKKSQEHTLFKLIHSFIIKHVGKAKIALQFYKDLFIRTILFITNKNYRKEAWQDRKRLIQLLKAKFFG